MTQDELKRAFRDATAQPPVGTRARVWRGILAKPAPRPRVLLQVAAFATCIALGAGLFAVLRPVKTSGQWNDEYSALVWTSAKVERQNRQVALEGGELGVSSWGAPVEVVAKGHTIRVEAGSGVVRVAGDSVTVDVTEGVLSFDGTLREATRASKDAAGSLSNRVAEIESAAARPRRLVARAERAVSERRFEDAVDAFAAVATSGSLDAEVANYKQGELELRQLGRPARALATFEAGEQRFTSGALRQERQLSAIESCVKLERWVEVERRTSAFLENHADSERRDEVKVLHATALAARGDVSGACAELREVPADRATSLREVCR